MCNKNILLNVTCNFTQYIYYICEVNLCMMNYIKSELSVLKNRVAEKRHLIQVIFGPRQVGKTTVVRQLLASLQNMPYHFAAADGVASSNFNWIDLVVN